jgi:rhamnosyltransferase
MNQVIVLMSIYNGEKYLAEQIESILAQKDVDFTLFVRDDGSKDSSAKILQKFQELNPDKIRIDLGGNVGCLGSFYRLLSQAIRIYPNANFFAFSDQDDIWLPHKLCVAVTTLQPYHDTTPNLYGCAFLPVDADLKPLPYRRRTYRNTFGEACVMNMILGCTMVFNRKAAELFLQAKVSDIVCLHDEWMYKACLAVGGNVFYDTAANILYRQHGNNVIGANKSFEKRWCTRFNNFLGAKKKRSTTLKNVYRVYSHLFTEDNADLVLPLVTYDFMKRLKVVCSRKYQTDSTVTNLLFKIACILNRY